MKRKIAAGLAVMLALSACLYTGAGRNGTDAAWAAGENDSFVAGGLLDMNELTGWAATDGSGQQKLAGGVTGGGTAQAVTVTDRDQFVRAVQDDIPRVVIVSGRIRAVTDTGYAVDVGSNKTIVGADKDAVIKGGINISNKSNIIVSNLTFEGNWLDEKEARTPDDCINVQNSHHIWFNHLNVHDAADGNLDIKLGSNFVTVSWCKFWYTNSKNNHRLSCLVGSGAGDHDDTDYGKLKVTYHHNWFADLCNERMPRVMYGTVHVYNNYYTCKNNLYCIGADCYASVLVENNYFEGVKNPHEFSYPDKTFPCVITARGNEYKNTSGKKDNGQSPNAVSSLTPFDDPPYGYILDAAKDVPEIVMQAAGPRDADPNATPAPRPTPKPQTSSEPSARPTPKPSLTPKPTAKPHATNAAPKLVTDKEKGEVWEFQGQNSDKTNGEVEIENPFAGMDLTEEPSYSGNYPVWTKGVTLTYWQYIPSGVSSEAAAINFSGSHRAIQFQDWSKYALKEEDGYQNRYGDNGGTYSLVREGDVTSGLQISSLGSFGFSEDDGTARDENPYTDSYGKVIEDFQQKNYFYYFANTSGKRTPLVSSKGKWHFVAVLIQNDLIQTYVDGEAYGPEYFNYFGESLTATGKYAGKSNGQSFNLGFGWKVSRRASSTSDFYSHGIPVLEFLSLENTKLYIGGTSTLWSGLLMNTYTTPKGIRIGDVEGYDRLLTQTEINTLMEGGTIPSTEPSESPSGSPSTEPSESPTEDILPGDVTLTGEVDIEDVLLALRGYLNVATLTERQQYAADMDHQNGITITDILEILRCAVGLR